VSCRSFESVDSRGEIREFLTTRRARLTPEQTGLPNFGGRRRVPGLRREEVALLAGMSVEYYVRLERGNATGVSEAVLEGISRVLQLDDAEHAHLYDLVRAANEGARTQQRRKSVRQQQVPLERLKEMAARGSSPLDAMAALKGQDVAVIAEVKRASPSRGAMAAIADPAALAADYEAGGARVIRLTKSSAAIASQKHSQKPSI